MLNATPATNATASSRAVSSSTLAAAQQPAPGRVGEVGRVAEQPRPQHDEQRRPDRPRQPLERLEAARAGQPGRPVADRRHGRDRAERGERHRRRRRAELREVAAVTGPRARSRGGSRSREPRPASASSSRLMIFAGHANSALTIAPSPSTASPPIPPVTASTPAPRTSSIGSSGSIGIAPRRLGRRQRHERHDAERQHRDREQLPPPATALAGDERRATRTAQDRATATVQRRQATMPLTEPRKISVPSEAPMITMPRRLPNISAPAPDEAAQRRDRRHRHQRRRDQRVGRVDEPLKALRPSPGCSPPGARSPAAGIRSIAITKTSSRPNTAANCRGEAKRRNRLQQNTSPTPFERTRPWRAYWHADERQIARRRVAACISRPWSGRTCVRALHLDAGRSAARRRHRPWRAATSSALREASGSAPTTRKR